MNKIYFYFIFLFLGLILGALFREKEYNKEILKELKELNSTVEYIDKRMDTLEFYRMPEEKKRWR